MLPKIYYSTAIRGSSVPLEKIRTHVKILQKFGAVLTEHLGSTNVDLGKNDDELFEEDIKLLSSCDIFIADVSTPSLGVGFMIAKAVELRKPVLALQYTGNNQPKLSAMINGCKEIVKMVYNSDESYEACVSNFCLIRTPQVIVKPEMIIYLTGPPGSGKSTLGRHLSSVFDIPYISTGELLRALDPNSVIGKVVNSFMTKGVLVPADIMCEIVQNKLRECNGRFILDGYPPSYCDLQNLVRLGIKPSLVIALTCSDEVAIKRQCFRNERITDTEEKAIARLSVYHSNIPSVDMLRKDWFECPTIQIDVENIDLSKVFRTAETSIRNYFYSKKDESYFPIGASPNVRLNSSRFHFHIDADSHQNVLKLSNLFLARNQDFFGQLKIYPIDYLQLGTQSSTDQTYSQMVNFHKIVPDNQEAFATGFLGVSFDEHRMLQVLNVAKSSGLNCMVEIEEYVGEWTLNQTEQAQDYDVKEKECADMSVLREFDENMVESLPPFELHLGFDLEKNGEEPPPIELDILVGESAEKGMDNGGWFIFKNKTHWKYRSNEFCYLVEREAKAKLFEQGFLLQQILIDHEVDCLVSMSLEIVHGIWVFHK